MHRFSVSSHISAPKHHIVKVKDVFRSECSEQWEGLWKDRGHQALSSEGAHLEKILSTLT